jgi:putative Mg2+ transporter-C (MgtC) family protein
VENLIPEIEILRLALAAAIGGIIGAEREYRNKSAGFRTLILICIGSCLFTILSAEIGKDSSDRIASNIVTGIGFLGAGVIFKSGNNVSGLTTAASVWVTAALGMAVGAGYHLAAMIGCGMVFSVLYLFTVLEKWIEKVNQIKNYKIVCNGQDQSLENYENLMQSYQLKFKKVSQKKSAMSLCGHWIVRGHKEKHRLFSEIILKDPSVIEFDF